MNASNLAFANLAFADVESESESESDPPMPRVRSRRAALPPASEHLSPRERQVVTLLHTGLTRKEVAYELGLNDATVRVHLWHAHRKSPRPR
jgi:DNA-binding NarL/FixJ family response regulator